MRQQQQVQPIIGGQSLPARALVTRMLASFVDLHPDDLVDNLRLAEDLALDSLDATELLVSLRERTGIVVSPEELAEIATVGDLVAVISARKDRFAG